MGAKDTNGVIATYGTGAVRHDHSKNFRDDGKRFDFSINSSSQYVSCEIYGYFALSNPPDDEVSGKMGGGRHSGNSDSRCYDMGIDCRTGDTRYRIESPHNDYSSGVSGGKGVGMSSNFIGYKFVKRNVGSGAATKVSIEIWQDTGNNQSTPSNQWKKVASWLLGDPNFATSSPPFYIPPSDHQETIRIDGPGGNPNLQYKWIGLREILSTDVEGGAVPGGGGTPTPTPTPGTSPPVIDAGVDLGTIPFVGLDLNGDGVTEGYDGNRDGKADGYDTNNDGIIDAIDVYGTGRANAFDTDGDGITDAYDTNGDGVIDKRGGGPGLNTSGPGGINSPDGSSSVPSVTYVTKKFKLMWAIDMVNVDACSINSPFETKDPQEIYTADADNFYSDSLNYRKTGIAVLESTDKKQKSVFVGKRIRQVEVVFKKFGIGLLTGLIYCRIRSSNGTIVEQFQNTVDSATLTNVDVVKTFTHNAPQHDIEVGDVIYIEFPEGGDPNNYLRTKITNSDKADGPLSCLTTDDGNQTLKNINKDLAGKVWA